MWFICSVVHCTAHGLIYGGESIVKSVDAIPWCCCCWPLDLQPEFTAVFGWLYKQQRKQQQQKWPSGRARNLWCHGARLCSATRCRPLSVPWMHIYAFKQQREQKKKRSPTHKINERQRHQREKSAAYLFIYRRLVPSSAMQYIPL